MTRTPWQGTNRDGGSATGSIQPLAEAVIDLSAVSHNIALVAGRTDAAVMAVVKADGYGHGAVPVARAALAGGASWLGVCTIGEALELRQAEIKAPILAWMIPHYVDCVPALQAGIDVSVSNADIVDSVCQAAQTSGHIARVHLKIDTGLSRSGAPWDQWRDLCVKAAKAEQAGLVSVVGVWSHLACADEPTHPSIAEQNQVFADALQVVQEVGLTPAVRHVANSAAALFLPDLHYDLVRVGIAMYGLEPSSSIPVDYDLHPVMTLQSRVMLVKRLAAGAGISYGHTYITERDTTVALIPLGYADGVPRRGSSRLQVVINGRLYPVVGRICMDQCVVNIGNDSVQAGDEVIMFGDRRIGALTADDWAQITDTIGYEIVVGIGSRVVRRYHPRQPLDTTKAQI